MASRIPGPGGVSQALTVFSRFIAGNPPFVA
jgi:hypothetical protein